MTRYCLGLTMIYITSTAISGYAVANQNQHDVITQQQSGAAITEIAELERRQQTDWGLSKKEWTHYQELMSSGVHQAMSAELTPLEVLGLEAKTDAERRKYVRLWVKQMEQWQQKLLAFEDTKMQILKEQYPELSVWYDKEEIRQQSLPDLIKGLAAHQDKRIVIYASADDCDAQCKQFIESVRDSASTSTRVDMFFVGTNHSDPVLRAAVKEVGLTHQDIDGKNLTVNHDKGYFARLEYPGVKTLPLAVRLDKSGQITPIHPW